MKKIEWAFGKGGNVGVKGNEYKKKKKKGRAMVIKEQWKVGGEIR